MAQISDAERFFANFLGTKKLRLTSQRKIIFNIFQTINDHIDVETLKEKSKAIDKNIGLATVYRTIKLLTDSGIVREVKSHDNKPLYEIALGRDHHDHLFCTLCGEKIEFVDHNMEALQIKIARKYGYELTAHSQYLYGVCKNCVDKTQ